MKQKNNNLVFTVDTDCVSVFNYLINNSKFNQKKIKNLFNQKNIFLNNELVKNLNCICVKNDLISITIDAETNNKKTSTTKFDEIQILYEDEYLLILNKPKNILTHSDQFESDNTIQNYLAVKFPYTNQITRNGIVHRLDKDTTGVLVIAKSNEIYNKLQLDFANNNVIRIYKAIVLNHFDLSKPQLYSINTMIGFKKNNSLKMTTNDPKNPKQAITILKVLNNLKNNCALVECELKTGRTHQIRVHMNYINHPVYNDPIYGVSISNDNFNQYLHCSYVKLIHPITYKHLEIKAELPIQFLNKIMELDSD